MQPDHVAPYAKTVKRLLIATQVMVVVASLILMVDGVSALTGGGQGAAPFQLHGSVHAAVFRTFPLVMGFGMLLSSIHAALSDEARVSRLATGQLLAGLFCFGCGVTMNFAMFLIR